MRRLLASVPGGFNTAMGEILKKYAHVLDTGDAEPAHNLEKAPESVPLQRNFAPYADSGGRKRQGGFYSDKPEEKAGYASLGRGDNRKETMEGETYRQTRAADVDAEKAFDRMAYHGTGDEPKKKKSPYAQP